MKSLRRLTTMFLLAILFVNCSSQPRITKDTSATLLFADDFNKGLDTSIWISEIAPLPDSKVYALNWKVFLDTKGGVTVWFNKKLSGNIRIEFTRTVVIDSGKNDRLSDLNVFWMASDPNHSNLFTRNGVLESYDSLQLYYVGMGGNTNSTTRFRKYEGNGERTLLQEYTDKPYLLEPNKEYHIVITIQGNTTTFEVNGQAFFSYTDSKLLKEGYFGFRSTKSRQAVDDFKVYQLKK